MIVQFYKIQIKPVATECKEHKYTYMKIYKENDDYLMLA
jgi:hypothetical protein